MSGTRKVLTRPLAAGSTVLSSLDVPRNVGHRRILRPSYARVPCLVTMLLAAFVTGFKKSPQLKLTPLYYPLENVFILKNHTIHQR